MKKINATLIVLLTVAGGFLGGMFGGFIGILNRPTYLFGYKPTISEALSDSRTANDLVGCVLLYAFIFGFLGLIAGAGLGTLIAFTGPSSNVGTSSSTPAPPVVQSPPRQV